MKNTILLLLGMFCLTAFGQQISLEDWNYQAMTNKRLLPKYGNVPRTEDEKKSDNEFIKSILEQDFTLRKGSDHLIQLVFSYLYRDIKTAMYRFNQAFLLDSTNTDIYWGYGSVYFTLGDYARAEKQFEQGLSIDPKNTHILTDYATCFLAQYYMLESVSEKKALENLDTAIIYMTKSYELDPTNQNTLFKLSICYWCKSDCDNAWKFYNECKSLGGQCITEEFTSDLKKKCKR